MNRTKTILKRMMSEMAMSHELDQISVKKSDILAYLRFLLLRHVHPKVRNALSMCRGKFNEQLC
jgi:hypothetical protein